MAPARVGAFIAFGIKNRGRHEALTADISDHRVPAAERHADEVTMQPVPHRLHGLKALESHQFGCQRRREPTRQRRREGSSVLVCEGHGWQCGRQIVIHNQGDSGRVPGKKWGDHQRSREEECCDRCQAESGAGRNPPRCRSGCRSSACPPSILPLPEGIAVGSGGLGVCAAWLGHKGSFQQRRSLPTQRRTVG